MITLYYKIEFFKDIKPSQLFRKVFERLSHKKVKYMDIIDVFFLM